MPRMQLEAVGLEFEQGGNTVWVHGPRGTIFRINCTGKIITRPCKVDGHSCTNVQVHGDIEICLVENTEEGLQNVH